ncbi:MAG: hypothetical protein NC311_17070 [Muribaculaceae bacterium]|nr:hypothetical protein [Muribaculaceae bacterium]
MKKYHLSKALVPLAVSFLFAPASAGAASNYKLATENLALSRQDTVLTLNADLILDAIRLGANRQIYISPQVTDDSGHRTLLPEILVNGRNMQYVVARGTIAAANSRHPDILRIITRKNNSPQKERYSVSFPYEGWMLDPTTALSFTIDSCGCGRPLGDELVSPAIPLNLNPGPQMLRAYITPEVTELPVFIHEGKARVQFEVDKTELHELPYTTKNGIHIDNRAELKVIDDSIRYALSDPSVEIAEINVCGYASPESPYIHNDELATKRSRALAEYISRRYSLPRESSKYDAVPENWGEFREMVVASSELSETQRRELLALIDEPAYGPYDYDEKEKTLKTDPRFAKLYSSLILPKWFPILRATKFQIVTRLRPMDDEQLAEVMKKNPRQMSLNQMFRVARLYKEGSPEFDAAIETALSVYPDDPTANLNAAIRALNEEDLDAAERYLKKAGHSPEAENARGILATYRGDSEAAKAYFLVSATPEAVRNRQLIK